MTSTSHPEGDSAETDVEPGEDVVDADFSVELGARPALTHPAIDVSLQVTIRRLAFGLVADGIVEQTDAGVRPVAHVREAIVDAVEREGYEVSSFESMDVPLPNDTDDVVDVDVELRVRALEGDDAEAGED